MPSVPSSSMAERTWSAPASYYDLTAASVAALRRSRWLAQVLLWIPIELLFALGATEVIRLPSVLGPSGGGSRFYIHAAHKIFHNGWAFHYNVSSVPSRSRSRSRKDGARTFCVPYATKWPVPGEAVGDQGGPGGLRMRMSHPSAP